MPFSFLKRRKGNDNGGRNGAAATRRDTATPADASSVESHGSEPTHSTGSSSRTGMHRSASQVGLDEFAESRKECGDFAARMVNIEFGKPIEEVYDGVHTGPVLGEGFSGYVRRVKHRATGHCYAVKCLDLRKVKSRNGLRQLQEEIIIMSQLDHPNIVRLEEVYESPYKIYLVQELCEGGELYDHLDKQPDEHYTEAECARLVAQMVDAVRYLHSKGIVHRDLKLENFLLSSKAPDADIVLIDFGLAKHFDYGQIHREAVGTRYTVAPEVIQGAYDEKCDVWGLGVLAFLLLSGDSPFGGNYSSESTLDVKANILGGHWNYERKEVWSVVSSRAKSFIEDVLVVDPKVRPTAEEAQKHPWLRQWARRRASNGGRLNPRIAASLLSFVNLNDVLRLFCEVVSFTLLPDQVSLLRKQFKKLDIDGSGEISREELRAALETSAGSRSTTEDDIEDLFNALRWSKTETRVHWHEFVAAGLSLCHVDERNLRLAYDRLDCDHSGFISFENVTDLMGNGMKSDDAVKIMWNESLKACGCQRDTLSYDDFSSLMNKHTGMLEGSCQEEPTVDEILNNLHLSPPKTGNLRPRSRSAGDAETYEDDDDEEEKFPLVPLSVNRTLFRTHRQMRLEVIEACARFEQQRTRHALQHLKSGDEDGGTDGSCKDVVTAGLVLRRGKRVDSEAALAWLRKTEKEQEALVRAAAKRSGRLGTKRHGNHSDLARSSPVDTKMHASRDDDD